MKAFTPIEIHGYFSPETKSEAQKINTRVEEANAELIAQSLQVEKILNPAYDEIDGLPGKIESLKKLGYKIISKSLKLYRDKKKLISVLVTECERYMEQKDREIIERGNEIIKIYEDMKWSLSQEWEKLEAFRKDETYMRLISERDDARRQLPSMHVNDAERVESLQGRLKKILAFELTGY